MTGKERAARGALDRLAAALVDDMMITPDDEILTEFREAGGDPEKHSAEMRALFEQTVIASNKSKLLAAKAGVARAKAAASSSFAVDVSRARQLLHDVLQNLPSSEKLTLAARKESELSDADVVGLLEDLSALGIAIPGRTTDG